MKNGQQSNDFEIIVFPNGTALINVTEPTKLSMAQQAKRQLATLNRTIDKLEIKTGVREALQAKVTAARGRVSDAVQNIKHGQNLPADNNLNAAINILGAFENQIEAQKGKGVTEVDAARLLETAKIIINNVKLSIQL